MAKKRQKNPHCLNCGHTFDAIQPENYCPNCGQENTTKKLAFGQLFTDFLGAVFSFDSKVFRSFIPLVFRPGFLTNAYVQGKRVPYISPLRIYLFMSLLYFTAISLLLPKDLLPDKFPDPDNIVISTPTNTLKIDSLIGELDSLETEKKEDFSLNFTSNDTITSMAFGETILRSMRLAKQYSATAVIDTLKIENSFLVSNKVLELATYQSVRIYKSGGKDFLNYFLGSLPLMMLIAMPVFAFILKILYLRRKRFLIEHLTFHFHFHAFFYFLFTLLLIIGYFWDFGILWLMMPVTAIYFFFALKKVYQQGTFKTLLKQSVFMFLYPVCIVFFMLFTLGISFFLF